MPYVCPVCGIEWGTRSRKSHRMCDACLKATGSHATRSSTTRTCRGCGTAVPREKSRTVSHFCTDCRKVRSNERRKRLRQSGDDQLKNSKILWMYGITVDDYNSRLAAQGGGCAICSAAPEEGKRLAVDHDHRCCPGRRSCGACVRGLLCRHCNLALGQFGDDPARVAQAAQYLTRSTHA